MKRIGQTRGVPPCFFVRDAAKGLSSREIGGAQVSISGGLGIEELPASRALI
jgi:hypothetical protein